MVVVAVSGGFDPIHVGHVRLMEAAKALGDELVIIMNNDVWLAAKKGKAFMPEEERKEILEALECVDRVVVTSHKEGFSDRSVAAELRELRPDVFANGGDRSPDFDDVPTPEYEVCQELGIKMVWGVGGGKVQSSSWLIENK